ncbi:MAG: hypothetical protein LBW85_04795 [Deltaproteobacteria bacterium]|jgi:hypothetical protein|nr:hypothetical protein [Deltaproteobacteria bacterium]
MPDYDEGLLAALLDSGLHLPMLHELRKDRELYGDLLSRLGLARRSGEGELPGPEAAAALLAQDGDGRLEAARDLLGSWSAALGRAWPAAPGGDGRDPRLGLLALHAAGLAVGLEPGLYPGAEETKNAVRTAALDEFKCLEPHWIAIRDLAAAGEVLADAGSELASVAGSLLTACAAPFPGGAAKDAGKAEGAPRPAPSSVIEDCLRHLAKGIRRLTASGALDDAEAAPDAPRPREGADAFGHFLASLPAWLGRAAGRLEEAKARLSGERERLLAEAASREAELARLGRARKAEVVSRFMPLAEKPHDRELLEAIILWAESPDGSDSPPAADILLSLAEEGRPLKPSEEKHFEDFTHGFVKALKEGELNNASGRTAWSAGSALNDSAPSETQEGETEALAGPEPAENGGFAETAPAEQQDGETEVQSEPEPPEAEGGAEGSPAGPAEGAAGARPGPEPPEAEGGGAEASPAGPAEGETEALAGPEPAETGGFAETAPAEQQEGETEVRPGPEPPEAEGGGAEASPAGPAEGATEVRPGPEPPEAEGGAEASPAGPAEGAAEARPGPEAAEGWVSSEASLTGDAHEEPEEGGHPEAQGPLPFLGATNETASTGWASRPDDAVSVTDQESSEEKQKREAQDLWQKNLRDIVVLLRDKSGKYDLTDDGPVDEGTLFPALEDRLIGLGEFDALYWYSRAMERKKRFPSWLAETAFLGTGFHWLQEGARARLVELFSQAAVSLEELDRAQKTLLAAAMIRPALCFQDPCIKPLLTALAADLATAPKLKALFGTIADNNDRGDIILGTDILSDAASELAREADRARLKEDTDKWRDSAPNKTIIFAGANDVYHRLVNSGGALYELVEKAEKADSPEAIELAAETLKNWQKPSFIKKEIDEISKTMRHKPKPKPIEARAKESLLEKINTATKLAERCLKLNRAAFQGGGDPSRRKYLGDLLTDLSKSARSVLSDRGALPDSPAGKILSRMLEELAGKYASAYGTEDTASAIPVTERETMLRLWLLKVRGPTVLGDGEGIDLNSWLFGFQNGGEMLDNCLAQTKGDGAHLASEATALFPGLGDGKDPETGLTLSRMLDDACAAYPGKVMNLLAGLKDRVEEQYVWGGIQLSDRESLAYELDSIERDMDGFRENGKRELPQPDRTAALRELAAAYAKLLDIQFKLDRYSYNARKAAEDKLEKLSREDFTLPPKAEILVKEMMSRKEYASAIDQLTRFQDELEAGRPVMMPSGQAEGRYIQEFYRALDSIHTSAGTSFKARGIELGPLWNGVFSDDKYLLPGKLSEFLRRLGFFLDLDVPLSGRRTGEGKPFYWTRIRVKDTVIDSRLPLWGSLAEGGHDLIFGKGAITPDNIARRLASYGISQAASVFVFCQTRLSPAQRALLGRSCRRDRVCPVVIDTNLIDFLDSRGDRETDNIAAAVLEAGAAGGYYNPYTPEAAGAVPKEMFYGRDRDIAELWSQYGPCILYGGRQLGKSAMLLQLAKRHHDPENGNYVLYQSARDASTLEGLVADMLRTAKLGNVKSNAAAIEEAIRGKLEDPGASGKWKRIVLLIDESDRLLDAELEKRFATLAVFRDIMQKTGRRFKIVLAGLHSVQRFHHYPNNPLAHFGVPLCIGPLDSKDAYDLVTKPMGALGITFESPSLAYKALSRTNYHPSLLQLACHALVEHIMESSDDAVSPPFTITGDVIDSVFRKTDLRERMRDRFEWTVDLDPRYRLIAYVIALMDQEKQPEGRSEGYRATELLEDFRYYWPAGFRDTDFDTAESLMDEMVGLGLLKRNAGRYAIRNFNILQLLQADSDIVTELDKFESMEYVPQSGPEGMRRLLPGPSGGPPSYVPSPLAFSVENRITSMGVGACLIAGSKALGIDRVIPALKTIFQESSGDSSSGDSVSVIPGGLPVAKQIEDIRKKYKSIKPGSQDRIIMIIKSDSPDRFWESFYNAVVFVNSRRDPRRFFKVIGIADAQCCMDKLDEFLKSKSKVKVDVHYLERWNRNSISNFLDSTNLAVDQTDSILDNTGGWDCLVMRELQAKLGQKAETEAAPEKFSLTAGFRTPSPLYRAIDSFLRFYCDAPFQEAEFPSDLKIYLQDHLQNADPKARTALNLPPRKVKSAFRLLRRLTVIVETPASHWPAGSAPAEPWYSVDRFYLGALKDEAEAEQAKAQEKPEAGPQ